MKNILSIFQNLKYLLLTVFIIEILNSLVNYYESRIFNNYLFEMFFEGVEGLIMLSIIPILIGFSTYLITSNLDKTIKFIKSIFIIEILIESLFLISSFYHNFLI